MKTFEFRDQLACQPLEDMADDMRVTIEILREFETLLEEAGDDVVADMSAFDLAAARCALETVRKAWVETVSALQEQIPDLLAHHELPVMRQLGESIRVGNLGPLFNPEIIHIEGGG